MMTEAMRGGLLGLGRGRDVRLLAAAGQRGAHGKQQQRGAQPGEQLSSILFHGNSLLNGIRCG